jgi:hypothetical protein
MKNIRAFCFLLFVALLLPLKLTAATYPVLSEESKISMLTASPGDELYSVFGHNAVRVTDPANNIDLVFNYGTFDFDTPNFYLKFVRGKLLYKLSVVPMEYFMAEYRFDGRAVFEQILHLTLLERQKMFNYLMENSLPENAYYHYDFFYDNCATRIRDLADDVLDIEWYKHPGIVPENLAEIRSLLDYEFEYQPSYKSYRSLREMLQPFLVNMPWSAFGIDLALGLPADKVATYYDFMYLPDEMLIAFALARHSDGRQLVTEHRILLQQTTQLAPAGFFTPEKVFWALFVLALISFVNRRFSRIFDLTFFSLLGITGLVILFLWFFTDHITTKINLNILWAIPTHLYYIWVSTYERKKPAGIFYFRIVSLLSLAMLVLWPFIPQGFNSAFFPIILTVLVKSIPYSFRLPYLTDHLTAKK